jgi:hypothetical protein
VTPILSDLEEFKNGQTVQAAFSVAVVMGDFLDHRGIGPVRGPPGDSGISEMTRFRIEIL